MTVIFDFDGTLADTIHLIQRIYNEHAHEFGAEQIQESEFSYLRSLGYKKALKAKKLRWRSLPRLVMFIRREMNQHMGEVQPYEGIVPLVQELRDNGIRIGILTSNSAETVRAFLDTHTFPVFDFVVSEKTIFGKEKALKRIMERHQIGRSEVVYVGDEPRDVASCKKAGIRVIGVTWGLGGPEMMQGSKPDLLVNTVAELRAALIN